ncbi:hypothetical protein RQP53_10125 [Paucibacter sp. APW11]|uniref:Uncharacterized protein n=1 Tax=Roseateles aquae TaxID=3077235 RepID=A0ABU3PAL5_9BURK|nr:hypothetical protein [Paucibacter sp. APW11]
MSSQVVPARRADVFWHMCDTQTDFDSVSHAVPTEHQWFVSKQFSISVTTPSQNEVAKQNNVHAPNEDARQRLTTGGRFI